MKAEIHPEYHPVVFVDGEHEIVTRSTLTSEKTREIEGVEHYVISIDISAYTHPFYTGKQKLMDTEGRVDRFFKRYNLTPEPEEEEEEEVEASEETTEEAAATEETAEEETTEEEASEEETSEEEK